MSRSQQLSQLPGTLDGVPATRVGKPSCTRLGERRSITDVTKEARGCRVSGDESGGGCARWALLTHGTVTGGRGTSRRSRLAGMPAGRRPSSFTVTGACSPAPTLRLRRGHRPHRRVAPPQHPTTPRPGRAARLPNAAARPSAGGGGHRPSPRCPPPPAFPPGGPDVSEAIDRIRDLRRAGFGFLHHHERCSTCPPRRPGMPRSSPGPSRPASGS